MRFSMIWIAALTAGATAQTEPVSQSASDHVALMRTRWGDHYADLLTRFIEELPTIVPGGVVFLGDSITEGFPLDEAFPGQNVINRGIGGDRIQGVIERLGVCVEALAPRRVYLMIGVNDLWWSDERRPEVLEVGYARLLDEIARRAPETELIVLSILPMGDRSDECNETIRDMNARIQALAEARDLEYVDLHPLFAGQDGKMLAELTTDGVHLSLDGYEAWLEGILPTEEFLDATLALRDRWMLTHSPRHRVDKVDPPREGEFGGNRGRNEMVIYTPAYGHPSTGTNEWGIEAAVDNGLVVSVDTAGDTPIPANGFVVSGHLESHRWIQANLWPGVGVEFDESEVRVASVPDMTPQQRLTVCRAELFDTLTLLEGEEMAEDLVADARAILREIITLRRQEEGPSEESLAILAARLDSLRSQAELLCGTGPE
jgi:lysophospholipase L1-like esterase